MKRPNSLTQLYSIIHSTKISPIAALFKEKELNKEALYFSFLILR